MSKTKSCTLYATMGRELSKMVFGGNISFADIPFDDRVTNSIHDAFNVGQSTRETCKLYKQLYEGLYIVFDKEVQLRMLGGGQKETITRRIYGIRLLNPNKKEPFANNYKLRVFFIKDTFLWDMVLPSSKACWGLEEPTEAEKRRAKWKLR